MAKKFCTLLLASNLALVLGFAATTCQARLTSAREHSSLAAGNLRCEYQTDPLAVESEAPRLSWTLTSPVRGARQTAYQILVANSLKNLAAGEIDGWDSGKVFSDKTSQIVYNGETFAPELEAYWKVRVWDEWDKPGPWSKPARWTTGQTTTALRLPEEWRGKWICSGLAETNSPWLRKTFTLAAVPERALAYVNAVGYFELYVNGRKVSTDVLAPAVSDLRVHSLYVAYDIAPYLKRGTNCIGLWCGRGWSTRAEPPGQRVRFQIRLPGESGDDSRFQLSLPPLPPLPGETVEEQRWLISDESWKVAPSPYTTLGSQAWGKFGGERYDANLENPRWCAPDFDDSAWANAQLAPAAPVRAEAQSCPPNRIGQVLPAVAVTALGEGRYEIDFGSNLSGWLRLKFRNLKAAQQIKIIYADRKFSADELKVKGKRPATVQLPASEGKVGYQQLGQMDEFVSAGRKQEQFESKFNYHGFRYAVVEGLAAAPKLKDAEAMLIESDLESAGAFACSNELFNRIHALNLWTIRCLNLGGYMVDCPHRERLGYGDGQVSIESQAYNLWTPAFYEKWAGDWRTAQRAESGDIPHTAPDWGGGGGPAWGGSLAALTWRMYELYGDRRALAENYEPMRRYVDFLETKCTNNVLRSYGGKWDFIGDWVPPERGMDTTNWPARPAAELFNNCYRVYLWEILAKSAAVLGKRAEVKRCKIALAKMRPAIHAAFYDATNHWYVLDEQAYQVMPLLTGVTPPELRTTVFATLETNIVHRRQGHLDTGMLGTYFLIEYLRGIGRDDLLFTIINQKTYPGWGFMLESGATTLWEQWNGYFSHIHSCFASPGGWFYQSLAGIRPDPAAPGFKKIIIKPALVGDVTWVKAHHDSIHGRIVSNWRRDSSKLAMEVTIPVNTTATIYVPTKDAASVTESGKPAADPVGARVILLREENGAAVFEVGGGTYQFQSRL